MKSKRTKERNKESPKVELHSSPVRRSRGRVGEPVEVQPVYRRHVRAAGVPRRRRGRRGSEEEFGPEHHRAVASALPCRLRRGSTRSGRGCGGRVLVCLANCGRLLALLWPRSRLCLLGCGLVGTQEVCDLLLGEEGERVGLGRRGIAAEYELLDPLLGAVGTSGAQVSSVLWISTSRVDGGSLTLPAGCTLVRTARWS